MDKKLYIAVIFLFIFLLSFIAFVLISECNNMQKLRGEYPSIQEEAYEYRKSNLSVWALSLIVKFLFPVLFLVFGFSKKLSVFSYGNNRGLFWTCFTYAAIFLIIELLITLPFDFYSSFVLKHRYNLSNQTLYRWLEVLLKNFIINGLTLSVFIWFPYYLMYKSPHRWWLYIGILAIPILAFVTFISPMYIDPLFNEYSSIENNSLGQEIKVLLKKSGIENAAIYKVDKSKDTKLMNAYMTGILKSKRIVLWDTTINKLDKEEVLSITAHEIGHYINGHIWKSIVLGGGFYLLLTFLIYKTSNWILLKSNGRFGFNKLYNIASIPLILLVLNLYMFFASPIINFNSRLMEKEADAYEINLTQNRKAAISSMLKLYEESLSLPRTSTIFKLWYHSHPMPEERIEFFNKYGDY